MNDFKLKIKELIQKMNEHGIPIPLIQLEQKATFSGTLSFISFNVWVVSVVGKWSGYLGGVDSGQCLQMFLACAGLYWGRKFQTGTSSLETTTKDGTTVESKEEKK